MLRTHFFFFFNVFVLQSWKKMTKNVEKAYFDQWLECIVPKRWLKYITGFTLLLILAHIGLFQVFLKPFFVAGGFSWLCILDMWGRILWILCNFNSTNERKIKLNLWRLVTRVYWIAWRFWKHESGPIFVPAIMSLYGTNVVWCHEILWRCGSVSICLFVVWNHFIFCHFFRFWIIGNRLPVSKW